MTEVSLGPDQKQCRPKSGDSQPVTERRNPNRNSSSPNCERWNPNQERCIHYGTGPLLIVASPGSGKTYTITRRIDYLINGLHIPPQEILVLTFSRAAAAEMKNRFIQLQGQNENVTFGTFHSVFFSVLRSAYGTNAENYILHNPDEEEPQFQEMLLLTRQLLYRRPDIRELLKKKYRWILIDEFQDIDALQYEIIRLITDPDSNLTVVGDDDQSIYGFRGARPDLMLHFREDYPDAELVTLDRNYRSTPEIVECAGKLIRHNQNRYLKSIKAVRGHGEKVRILEFTDAKEQCRFLAAELQDYLSKEGNIKEVVILCRTNREEWVVSNLLADCHVTPDFMTYHKSKGLEYDVVYMIDCNEGVTPNQRCTDMEEERRAFYVAMTRARKKLTLCYVRKRRGKDAFPSRFVEEVMEAGVSDFTKQYVPHRAGNPSESKKAGTTKNEICKELYLKKIYAKFILCLKSLFGGSYGKRSNSNNRIR